MGYVTMSKRSLTLAEKLNRRFQPDIDVLEAIRLINTAQSDQRFDSQAEFAHHLAEGALLNISAIGSRALSVPCGEYMVWLTDAGHTMLVPTTDTKPNGEVYEHATDAFEVQTRDLLANWNRIERVLFEAEESFGGEEPTHQPGAVDAEEGAAGEFRNTVDTSTVDRTAILQSMEGHGFTVTSLAQAVGVDPPAISRILREPKDTQGDRGGRNPSMGLASQICGVLRIDPTVAFPNIFTTQHKYQPRQQEGNEGSGSHSHGKGGETWTQGATGMHEAKEFL